MPCSNMSLVANTESRKFTCIGFYSVPVGSVGSATISTEDCGPCGKEITMLN